jgi:hypothetical protein
MKNHDCTLQPWEVAQCPKIKETFEQVIEKAAKIIYSLKQWAAESVDHELRMQILCILGEVTEITVMLQDTGFDADGVMERYTAELDSISMAPEISELLASIQGGYHLMGENHDNI